MMLMLPGMVSKGDNLLVRRPSTYPLEDLEVVRELGRGSSGTVKLVRVRTCTGWELQALKIVDKWQLVAEFDGQRRLETERDFLVRFCRDPDVCQTKHMTRFIGCHQTHHHLHFFFEYLAAGDLLGVIQEKGPLPPENVKLGAFQLIRALNFMHAHGILHGDVTLQNVLVDSAGDLRICDLSSCLKATDSYLIDWKALGVLIFELSTGLIPLQNVYLPWPISHQSAEWKEVRSLADLLIKFNRKEFVMEFCINQTLKVVELQNTSPNEQAKQSDEDEDSSEQGQFDPMPLRNFSFHENSLCF